MSTFASRRKNQKRNKQRRIAKNRIKYLPVDFHGSIRLELIATGKHPHAQNSGRAYNAFGIAEATGQEYQEAA